MGVAGSALEAVTDILEKRSGGPFVGPPQLYRSDPCQRLTCSFRANRVNPRTQAENDIPRFGGCQKILHRLHDAGFRQLVECLGSTTFRPDIRAPFECGNLSEILTPGVRLAIERRADGVLTGLARKSGPEWTPSELPL